VTKIDIRCGFGNVVPSKFGIVYATVVFKGVGGATKAMDKNGHTFLGKNIIVSRDNVLGLPLLLMSYLAGLPQLSRYAGGQRGAAKKGEE
jgi:hypothetical protein